MKAGLFLCALIAAALPSAAAWAEPAFDVFKAACIDTSVDHGAALSVDAVRDWPAAPQSLIDGLSGKRPSGETNSNVEAKLKGSSKAAALAIVVAHTTHISDGVAVPADVCGVMTMGRVDASELKAKAAGYAAVPLNQALIDAQFDADARKNAVIYAWRDEGGHHTPLTMAEVAQAKAGDAVLVLTLISEPDQAVLGLAVPAK